MVIVEESPSDIEADGDDVISKFALPAVMLALTPVSAKVPVFLIVTDCAVCVPYPTTAAGNVMLDGLNVNSGVGTDVTVIVAEADFVVSAVAVTITVYVLASVGVHTTASTPLLTHLAKPLLLVEVPGTETVKSGVFTIATVNVIGVPTVVLADVGDMEIETFESKVAEADFVVSAVAVTVTVYIPAAVGVQTTVFAPLLTHPAADGAESVKSAVFTRVTTNVFDTPTFVFTVTGEMEIETFGVV